MTLRIFLFAAAIVSLASTASAQGANASAQDTAGAAAFEERCSYCHSTDGAESLGTNLVEKAPADFGAFEQIVRSGRSGQNGDMPAFSREALSEAELRTIHAYLLSLRQRDH